MKTRNKLFLITGFAIALIWQFVQKYSIHDYPTPDWFQILGFRICVIAFFGALIFALPDNKC